MSHDPFYLSPVRACLMPKLKTKQTSHQRRRRNEGWDLWEKDRFTGPISISGRRGSPKAKLHGILVGRTIRDGDTGERERGAHRDTEGGWAGFTHTTGSQGFPSRIGQSCTRRHGGRRGPPTGCALLVLLLLTRDSDRLAARWTPYSTGDLSRLATFLRLLTGSLSLSRAHCH